MKATLTITERNRIVEEHLHYIDRVIRKNHHLMKAARLDYDDVYQQLALRLIRAVEGYDPDKSELGAHIWAQLQFEMLNCKDAARRYGIKDAPYNARGLVISFDALSGDSRLEETYFAYRLAA